MRPLRAVACLALVVEQHLGQIASFDTQSFTALNTTFLNDGAVIHVAADVEVDRPIHLVYIFDATAGNGATHPRNLSVLDRFAKATVLEV